MGESYVLAADLGGTNLRIAAVTSDGSILQQRRAATPQTGDASDIIDTIVNEIDACMSGVGGKPLALVLAAAALVDSSGTSVLSSPNLPSLDGLALADILFARCGIRAALENDATAAAIGEHWLGASRGVNNSICITLGTGVGGGLILNGRPYRGSGGTAGEIGHICVEPDGLPCGCGSTGCLEQYASATAITRIARELLASYPDSTLNKIQDAGSDDIYEAGLQGDAAALETFRQMGRYLGIAIAGLVDVLNPEVIVIGGGASGAWQLFHGHVQDEMLARAFTHPAELVKIVPAELGDRAGILGAARTAFEAADRRNTVISSLS